MIENDPIDPQLVIKEVKALLNAAWNTASQTRYDQLLNWARESLKPLADNKYPDALWLSCSIPNDKAKDLDGATFEKRRLIAMQVAADAGSAPAKFQLACELDNEPTLHESSKLFKAAAEQGHTYSKWCYGLNLLAGRGIEKNEVLGLRYIEEAGQEKFEGAIQFLSKAYAEGTYGYPKDEGVAAAWWARLKDKDVIHF